MKSYSSLFFLSIFFAFCPLADAAQLKSFDAKTQVFIFEDGQRVVIEGIHIEEAASRVIASLLSGSECLIEGEGGASQISDTIKGELFVDLKTADFPPKQGVSIKIQRTAVSEFLLSQGSATVIEDLQFKNRDKFLKIQQEAKKRGLGIWSKQLFIKAE